ncbi:hypothetical protein [Actinomycetospora flava]|uniref:HTH araC/xylS-type domain-containing protein n=1 Tax=Actinomycetospora flava TaxID=3129232 RepID=A0ABU8M6U9_9PSEU
MAVVRADFSTGDPALAEDLIRRMYVDQRLTLSGRPERFALEHHAMVVPGPGSVTLQQLLHTRTMRCEVEPDAVGDALIVDVPRSGSVALVDCSDFEDVVAGPGEVVLGAPTGRFAGVVAGGFDATVLSHHEVAAHAAARTGIAADAVRFTGLAPVGPRIGSSWVRTVAHVRDRVLAREDLVDEPLVLDGVHRLLATAVLATFPNTALEALRDPRGRAGDVGETSAERAVDFVHAHAGEPVRPAEVAARAGAPTRDVDTALRRRRNTTLARELWLARMRGAHADLCVGDPAAGDTVAAIAARWGFTSLARFAVAYTMTTGGETPEDTLHR